MVGFSKSVTMALTGALFSCASYGHNYITTDAQHFAALYKTGNITREQLKENYLKVGSQGVALFTPYRIVDEANLFTKIQNNKAGYDKAMSLCLPVALEFSEEAEAILSKVSSLLEQPDVAPVYVLFGANNSGGTANDKGLAIGLEVLCRFADNQQEFETILRSFIAHEIVHVYQSRIALASQSTTLNAPPSLLRQSLIEGTADFVAELVVGEMANSEKERHEYGRKHEHSLWLEFSELMHNQDLGDWLYKTPNSNKPNDMGYWIGKQIAAAFYHNATDKTLALKLLLALENPEDILLKSQYQP